jgi:TPR repeat protein
MSFSELRQRAEAGSCAAQSILGVGYLYGTDETSVDYEQAHRFLSAAAEKGASRAVVNLADMYAQGLGVLKDIEKAVQLYERVGRVEFLAAIALGRIYSAGAGVPEDQDRALTWYSAALAFEGRVADCDHELREADAYVRNSRPNESSGETGGDRPKHE